MRTILILIFTFFIIKANGQSFLHYTDTLNHFSIDYPANWNYEAMPVQKGVVFSATKIPVSKDSARDNINVSIIPTPTKTLEKTFADYLRYLGTMPDYKVVETGDTTLNGTPFKWLLAHAINMYDQKTTMRNYNLVTIRNGKTFILTGTTFPHTYNEIRPLFDKIANSFKFLD